MRVLHILNCQHQGLNPIALGKSQADGFWQTMCFEESYQNLCHMSLVKMNSDKESIGWPYT